MATNALTVDAARSDGFPVYSLTLEEKWREMQLLLRYDRTRLIGDGIIGHRLHCTTKVFRPEGVGNMGTV